MVHLCVKTVMNNGFSPKSIPISHEKWTMVTYNFHLALFHSDNALCTDFTYFLICYSIFRIVFVCVFYFDLVFTFKMSRNARPFGFNLILSVVVVDVALFFLFLYSNMAQSWNISHRAGINISRFWLLFWISNAFVSSEHNFRLEFISLENIKLHFVVHLKW